MDPALDVLKRALVGDDGALSFLDRTSAIYVLDATDPSRPKTYGGWNFLHQALNEVERHESLNTSNAPHEGNLSAHVQLLITLAERVARRSPAADRNLVTTCIHNASQGSLTTNAEGLIVLNAEIREIVMGRIAAMAFDFSFHNRNGPRVSAFSDPVAMEKLCAVLAANAVSTGPPAVHHFMVEWVIPSAQALPPYSVASVICHLAIEALRKGAPAGTRDVLQRLSHPVVAMVLAPVLVDAISDGRESSEGISTRDQTNRVAAVSIRALERWCTVTDMSLPQIKHICAKVQIDIVEVISDALYSDSQFVVDAMAELIEVCLIQNDEQKVSKDRMTQARYIMEVDEDSFRSISPEDLFRIESKELDSVLGELVAAVGLQRFRFVARQTNGDDDVCRNLTRIAASVGSAALSGLLSGQIQGGGAGILDLLMKSAAHPSVNICGIALDILSNLVSLDPGFILHLLEVLQRRAIVPHIIVGGVPTILASDVCGVDFHEFESFRQNILTDALQACFRQNAPYYMNSCTSAIEEFCSAEPTVAVSFQLEAALYCMGAVSMEVMASQKNEMKLEGVEAPGRNHNIQLTRCLSALGTKPVCITANPLTLAQLNHFLRQYGWWYARDGNETSLSIAADLALSTFIMAGTAFAPGEPARDMLSEMSSTPFSEAAEALRIILSRKSKHFISQQAMSSLGGAWESSYAASNKAGALSVEDRIAFATGICHVFASLPPQHRAKSFHAFCLPTLSCLNSMLEMANSRGEGQLSAILTRIADEITLLSSILFSYDCALKSDGERGLNSTNFENPRIAVLREVWPSISLAAKSFAYDKKISTSLGNFLTSCIPKVLMKGEDVAMLRELCSLSSSLIKQQDGRSPALFAVYELLQEVFDIHGPAIDEATQKWLNNGQDAQSLTPVEEVGQIVESLMSSAIDNAKSSLGSAWNRPKEQGQGQTPFESKTKTEPELRTTAPETLTKIYSLVETCSRRSPIFLTHLPSAPGMDRDVDLLLRCAVTSAVSSLGDDDVEICRHAMLFLKSSVEILSAPMTQTAAQQAVEEVFEGVRQSAICSLVAGACGFLHPTTLDPSAALMYSILRTCPPETARVYCKVALQQAAFKLGETSKAIVLTFLGRCSTGELPSSALMNLFEDVWELHQVEENASISESDLVLRFAEQYATS